MNEVKEVNPFAPAAVEKPTQKIKRTYRRRQVVEPLKQETKAFVEVEKIFQPKTETTKKSCGREAVLPDAKWLAEFARALLGLT
jgi:hypothetical protein